MESILHEYVLNISKQSVQVAANAKRKADYTDVLFVLRKDEKKYQRARDLLQKRHELKSVKSTPTDLFNG